MPPRGGRKQHPGNRHHSNNHHGQMGSNHNNMGGGRGGHDHGQHNMGMHRGGIHQSNMMGRGGHGNSMGRGPGNFNGRNNHLDQFQSHHANKNDGGAPGHHNNQAPGGHYQHFQQHQMQNQRQRPAPQQHQQQQAEIAPIQIMDINKYLEQFPQLEDQCKVMFRQKYEELRGSPPIPQLEDYVLTIGIKCDSTREVVSENFQVLFQDKTGELVKFLFDVVAPRIKQMASALSKQNGVFTDEPIDFNNNGQRKQQAESQPQDQQQQKQPQPFGTNEMKIETRFNSDNFQQQQQQPQHKQPESTQPFNQNNKQQRFNNMDATQQFQQPQQRGNSQMRGNQNNMQQQRRQNQGGGRDNRQDFPSHQNDHMQNNHPRRQQNMGGDRGGNSGSQGQGQQASQFMMMGQQQPQMNQADHMGQQANNVFNQGGPNNQVCHCKYIQMRERQMLMQGGPHNSMQQRKFNKLLGKPCFKCGGIISAGVSSNQPQGRNNNNFQQQRNDSANGPNHNMQQKKRIRPEDLDCELDAIVQRDKTAPERTPGNSKAPFDPNKRQKRSFNQGGPGSYQSGMQDSRFGDNRNQNFDMRHQQRKPSFENSGMAPFGKNKRDNSSFNNFGQNQSRHSEGGPDGMNQKGFNNKNQGYQQQQYGRDVAQGFNNQHQMNKFMQPPHGFNKGGDYNQQQHQSSNYQPREQRQLIEPELTGAEAEELKKKRLERFGPVEPIAPIVTNLDNGKSGDGTQKTQQDKIQVRCKHWPKCNKSEAQCEYVHPRDECKFFPKCTYGEKCLFVHPEIHCKFADQCTRPNCNYRHNHGMWGANNLMSSMKPWLMFAAQGMMKNPSMFINNFNANTTTPSSAVPPKKESALPLAQDGDKSQSEQK